MGNSGTSNRENNPRRGREPRRFISLVEQLHSQAHQRSPSADNQSPHEAPLVAVTRRLVWATCLLVVVGFLAFGAAVLQWLALRSQLNEMRAASVDMKASIEATNRLGDAVTRSNVEAHRLADEAKRSADTAEGSLETARNTAKRQLRAYIFVSHDPADHVPDIESQEPMSTRVTLKNFGVTPAYDVTTWIVVKLQEYELLPPLPIPAPGQPRGRSILSPGEQVGLVIDNLDPLTSVERTDVKNGKRMIYVYGGADYKDVFGTPHYSRFRLIYGGIIVPSKKFVWAENGNEAD